jgi:hypothetical protein
MPAAHNGIFSFFFFENGNLLLLLVLPNKTCGPSIKKIHEKEKRPRGLAKWATSVQARFNSALGPCLSSGPINLDHRSQSDG